MSVRTGLDTGIFVLLASGSPEALAIWEEAVAGDREGVVSVLTLYELCRLGFRGAIGREFAEQALESIPQVCEVAEVRGADSIRAAARRAHGLDLSLADALILAAFIDHDCEEAYTTDQDLLRFEGPRPRVHLLSPS